MQTKDHHGLFALGILTLLVSILLAIGCATSVQAQREPIESVDPVADPSMVEPDVPPFQASRMLGMLDITEPERAVAPSSPADSLNAPAPSPSSSVSEKTIVAVGTGLSEAEAKSDALSALSGILYSQVVSSIQSKDLVLEFDGKLVGTQSSMAQDIVVSTSLPILGVSYSAVPKTNYDVTRKATVYQIDVVLKASSSLPLYESELSILASHIANVESSLSQAVDSLAREEQLSLLMGQYLQYEKLAYVARALGSKDIPVLKQSRYSIEAQLMELGRVNDSYARAALNLTKSVAQSKVYVYPAKLNASGGVTEFAEQLSYAMRDSLGSQSVSDPQRASYFLLGTYTLRDEGRAGIYVAYRLEDRSGNVVSTSMAELLPSVYAGQRFIPVAYDFQKQLERGDSVDTGFSVDIRINGMKDYLSFKSGDNLTIEVRSSAPCYFYVVGYVFNDQGERFSYLFPLKLDAVGKDMFVHRVSPEDVSKWIIINPTYQGKVMPIEVIEPYGVESLQVYASTEKDYQRFLDTVPGFREARDYYVVSDNPEEGLRLTRALNIKKVAEQATEEIQRSEAAVSFKSGK